MKLSMFKTVAAIAAIGLSGAATAAPIPPEGLFFSAWNGNIDAPKSIVINLSELTSDFRANPDAFTFSLLTQDPTANAVLTNFLAQTAAEGTLGTVQWGVFGANLGPSPGPNYGMLTTSTNAATADPQGWGLFTGLDQGVSNIALFRTDPTAGTANLTGTTNAYFANNINSLFSPQFNGGPGIQPLAPVNQSMTFFKLFPDQGGNEFFEGDLTAYGTFSLTYAVGGVASLFYTSTAPIPLPAAFWLLGSALLGLAGVARPARGRGSSAAKDAAA
jgi:hypothetical protein